MRLLSFPASEPEQFQGARLNDSRANRNASRGVHVDGRAPGMRDLSPYNLDQESHSSSGIPPFSDEEFPRQQVAIAGHGPAMKPEKGVRL